MSRKNLSVTIKIPKFFRDKLKNKKINNIYKRFEKSLNINESFAVAVSGGPDSLALAFLAKIFCFREYISLTLSGTIDSCALTLLGKGGIASTTIFFSS